MKRILVAVLSLLTIAAQAQKTTPKKTTTVKKTTAKQPSVLKNLNDSASYAIGISVANFYNQQGMKNLNSVMVAKAINDVYGKKKPLLNEQQANECVMNLMNKSVMDKVKPNIEAGEKFLAENKKNPNIKTTATGLQYEVITEGKGPKPSATD